MYAFGACSLLALSWCLYSLFERTMDAYSAYPLLPNKQLSSSF